MELKEKLILEKLPKHIAVIMDGNGRWAKKRGLLRGVGHKNGVTAVKQTIEACAELGVSNLTLYAFSSENWNRPKAEVDTLMNLLVSSLRKELDTLQKNNISLQAIGNLENLPKKAQKKLQDVIDLTANNDRLTLTLALSYGARAELTKAVKEISTLVKNNLISVDDVDESYINKHLYTRTMPDVDLMIRTSGEQRVSNFLLWQIAYAEFYFDEVLWPDFRKENLYQAIYNYQNRERRFGKTSDQIK